MKTTFLLVLYCLSIAVYAQDLNTITAGSEQTICQDSAQISSLLPDNLTGKWSMVKGHGFFSNISSKNTTVSGLFEGENVLVWKTDASLSADADTIRIENGSFQVNAGNDQSLLTDFASLEAFADPVWGTKWKCKWTVIAGNGIFYNDELPATNIDLLNPGINWVRWTVSKGKCTSFDDVKLTVNNIKPCCGPELKFLCIDTTQMNAHEPYIGTGKWSVIQGSGSFDNPTLYNTIARNIGKGDNIFRWTVTTRASETYIDMLIENYSAIANAGKDREICENYITLAAQSATSGSSGAWSIAKGGGLFNSSTLPNTKVIDVYENENIFVWTVKSKFCTATDSVKIINGSFQVYAGAEQSLMTNSASLEAFADPVWGTKWKSKWTVIAGNGVFTHDTLPLTNIDMLNPGINWVRWTVFKGKCTSFDDVKLTVNCCPNPSIPNQFICADTTQMEARELYIGTGRWSVIRGSGTFDNPTLYNTMARNIGKSPNIFRWTRMKSGFEAYDDAVISNYSFTIDVGKDIFTCDSIVQLKSHETNNSNFYPYWRILEGSGKFQNPFDSITMVSGLQNGRNVFIRKVTGDGCQVQDTIVVTYAKATGLADVSEFNSRNCYPNPTDGLVYFQNLNSATLAVVYDLSGKELLQQSVENKQNIDIRQLNTGIYILHLSSPQFSKIIKLIKK